MVKTLPLLQCVEEHRSILEVHSPEYAAVFGNKQNVSFPSSFLFTRPCAMPLFSCSLVWKARYKGKILLMSGKCKENAGSLEQHQHW